MKINWDRTYLKYSFYIVITATALYILYGIIGHAGAIFTGFGNAISEILSLLAPFIIALVIAYLLHPLVCWIERNIMNSKRFDKRLNLPAQFKSKKTNTNKSSITKSDQTKRTISVLLTYILVLSMIVIFIYSTYVMIGGQLSSKLSINGMINSIASYSERYNVVFTKVLDYMEKSGLSENLKDQVKKTILTLNNVIGDSVGNIFTHIKNLGNNLLNIFLGLIISFYVLKDMEYFRKLYRDMMGLFFKRKSNERISYFMKDANAVVSKFIRGQLLDGLIVGALSSIGLSIVGLDFAVLIGMTAGIANIIPYFGPIIGGVPALIVGLLSGQPIKALLAVGVLLLIQQLDGAIIAPKIIGESVGLHPVFIILSIIIGGAYMGLLGMLIAVPVAAIIKLFIIRWMEYRRQKNIAGD